MRSFRPAVLPPCLVFVLLAAAMPAAPARADDIDIPYTLEVLDNGLTLIVHEDHKAPIVAVNIWYHVGSKNESPGRTGFAHLFEHLMFQGSENFDEDYISSLQNVGATDLNGTTWFDRTNYFETVPKNALDTALWLESDRMGHFAGAISQEKLDEQRGVVQNEKRQGDNQPYGRVWEQILEQVFPGAHPYHWETIGSMADLDAATVEDARQWFKTWYGPNNAVIAIAGDVNTATVIDKVRRYFGDIPPGPPLTRPETWIPRHSEERREVMQDRVPQARLYKVWSGPEWGSADANYLALAAAIIGGDKNSRLYKRLVYDDQIATDVEVAPMTFEIAGLTYLVASAQPGHTLDELETAAAEEIAEFVRKGPTRRELERVKTETRAQFLRGIEGVGGTSGKAGILARNMVYGGSPDYYKQTLAMVDGATREDLRKTAERWMGPGAFVLDVQPYPELAAAETGADRSAPPTPGAFPDVGFPSFTRMKLDNGLELISVYRPGSPLVSMSLVFDAGYASDQFSRPGTAKMAMAMLDDGTSRRTSLEISEALALQGASLMAGSNLDTSFVALSALTENLEPSLDIFADVIQDPIFPQDELDRHRRITVNNIRQEKTEPTSMGLRVVPQLLYGRQHAYGEPMTGSGTEASVAAIRRDDLIDFHNTWFKPNDATLIVVGGVTAERLRPMVEKLFGDWAPGEVPQKELGVVEPADANTLYVVDRPDSDQSVIFAAQLLPPKANPDEVAIQAMNDILGGTFGARINMNLREDKHWSYGAYSIIRDARGRRPLMAYAQVQSDKTTESIAELRREIDEIRGKRPPTGAELEAAKRQDTLSLPGRWESGANILASLSEIVEFGLPDDYWNGYAARVNALDVADVDHAAQAYIQPEHTIWVVVGDRGTVEDHFAELGFGRITLIDADGNPDGP